MASFSKKAKVAPKKKAAAKKKEVAPVPNGTVPASMAARMTAAAAKGRGFEGMESKDYAIPFIKILDKSSAVCIESSDAYIEGARPGAIFNTVDQAITSGEDGIHVIPCGFKSVILEWESDQPGSGFIAEHPCSSDIKSLAQPNDKGQPVLPDGHMLQDANNHYVLHVKDPDDLSDFDQVVISMSGTQLTKSRRWNSMMSGRKAELPDGTRFTPPTYGVLYHLSTAPQSRDTFHWHGWEIFDSGLVEDESLFQHAEDFADTILKGAVKANYNAGQTEPGATENDEGEDVPF